MRPVVPAVTMILLLAACASPPSPSPEASATREVPVYQFEADPLAVEQYPDVAALVPAFFAENTEWVNVGGNAENQAIWFNSSDGPTFVDRLLRESDNSYLEALVVPDYDPASPLGAWVDRQIEGHENTLNLNFSTTPVEGEFFDPADLEAYVRSYNVESATPIPTDSPDRLMARVVVVESDNSDKNTAVELTHGVEVDPTPQTVVLTWANVNGRWLLTDFVG